MLLLLSAVWLVASCWNLERADWKETEGSLELMYRLCTSRPLLLLLLIGLSRLTTPAPPAVVLVALSLESVVAALTTSLVTLSGPA